MQKEIYSKEYLCEQIVQSKLFIDAHFSSNIRLEDIAAKAFLSKFHFIRLFKKIYGKTPYQYLIAVRVRHAKELLQTGMTVNEVCFSIGFDSATTFAGLFRKMTGLSPVLYRRKKSNFEEPVV